MGRFCLFADTGLTDGFRHARVFVQLSKSSQAYPNRKKRADFRKNFIWWRTKPIFQTKMWEV